MTELEKYKQALTLARETMRVLTRAQTKEQAEDTLYRADGAINTILNPPPATETVEVETWWVFNDDVRCFQANSKEECIMWARNVGQPEKIQYVKLTGTVTREVPQKMERSVSVEASFVLDSSAPHFSQKVVAPWLDELPTGKTGTLTFSWHE